MYNSYVLYCTQCCTNTPKLPVRHSILPPIPKQQYFALLSVSILLLCPADSRAHCGQQRFFWEKMQLSLHFSPQLFCTLLSSLLLLSASSHRLCGWQHHIRSLPFSFNTWYLYLSFSSLADNFPSWKCSGLIVNFIFMCGHLFCT